MTLTAALKKILALSLAAAVLCLCASCSFDFLPGKKADESTAPSEPETVTVSETETEAPVPDENYEAVPGAEKFVSAWHDKYSNRCDMIISHIGGNYYDINLWWGHGRESAICMSFVGTYNAETDAMDYTGMEYELHITENNEYSADVIGTDKSGSFSFKNEDTVVWSEREECKFIEKGKPYEGDSFRKIFSPSGVVYVMDSEDYSYDDEAPQVVAALPGGAIVNVIESGEESSLIACGPYKGYVPSENLVSTGLAYSVSSVSAAFQDDIDNSDYPDYVASSGEYAVDVALIPEGTVTDLRYYSISVKDQDENGDFRFSGEREFTLREADSPVIIRMEFYGDIPNNGISYVDSEGASHSYSLSLSGKDGSLVMSEIIIDEQ